MDDRARRDAACLVAALAHPATGRATFELVGAERGGPQAWDERFAGLVPDR
jgi:hypothetical protein